MEKPGEACIPEVYEMSDMGSSDIIDTDSRESKSPSVSIENVNILMKSVRRNRAKSVSDSEMCESCSHCADYLSERHHDLLIINFSKDYLSEIPGNKLVKLIKQTYPEYLDRNRNLTIDGLIKLIKHGAELNH